MLLYSLLALYALLLSVKQGVVRMVGAELKINTTMIYFTYAPSKRYARTHRMGMLRIGLIKMLEALRPVKVTSITF